VIQVYRVERPFGSLPPSIEFGMISKCAVDADGRLYICQRSDPPVIVFDRPTLYGAAAGGLPGVKKAVDILRGEIDLVMGQIGCPRLDRLGPDFLWRDDWPRNI
jgi:hypothetical protein